MKKDEYLSELEKALSFLDDDTRSTALNFYTEMLEDRMEDGKDEESAVADMEPVADIAARLSDESSEKREKTDDSGESLNDTINHMVDKLIQEQVVEPLINIPFMENVETNFYSTRDKVQESMNKAAAEAERYAEEVHRSTSSKDSSGDYQKYTVNFPCDENHPFHSLTLQVCNRPIRIFPSEDETFSLEYYAKHESDFNYTNQNGYISLVENTNNVRTFSIKFFCFDFVSGSYGDAVCVHIPKTALIDLSAETTNDSIKLEGMKSLCQVSLKTSNAKIEVQNCAALSMNAVSCNGRIMLESVTSKKDLIAETLNSKIEACDVSAQLLKLVTKNAHVNAENCIAQEEILIKTSNGSVTVDACDAKTINLKSSNASLNGTLPGAMGDWSIESETSNAKNTLPEHQSGGDKKLLAFTSNGNIRIGFERE